MPRTAEMTAALNAYAQELLAEMTEAERALFARLPEDVRKGMIFTGWKMDRAAA